MFFTPFFSLQNEESVANILVAYEVNNDAKRGNNSIGQKKVTKWPMINKIRLMYKLGYIQGGVEIVPLQKIPRLVQM